MVQAPRHPSPLPSFIGLMHSHLPSANSFLILFHHQHMPLMKSLGFSPLSPVHLSLISLFFPLIPNNWHHHPTLYHHPLHPHPSFLYSCSLCSFIFYSAFMASLVPHHGLCSYNDSVVLRWSKMSLICFNWGERSVCPKWKVWVIGYLGEKMQSHYFQVHKVIPMTKTRR